MLNERKYILKCFIIFLKKNNAFKEFLELLKKCRSNKNAIQFLTQHCTYNPADLIINAFPWINNKIVSWPNLHVKWRKICKEKNFIKE